MSSSNSKEWLQKGIERESKQFEEMYLWLEEHMPPSFFEEVDHENILLITHSLMGFELQDHFCHIKVKNRAYAMCLDSPEADVKILTNFQMHGIKNYRTYVSNTAPFFVKTKSLLRITVISFTEMAQKLEPIDSVLPLDKQKEVLSLLQKRNPDVQENDFVDLLKQLNPRFLRSFSGERLIIALDMFFRAKKRDNCQYEIKYNEDWKEKDTPSMQIVFAWRNVPKNNFLLKLAKTVFRHGLVLKRVNAIYIHPYSRQNILIMSIGINGKDGKSAWEQADIEDFVKELVTLKYFEGMKNIEATFVDTHLVSGNLGNLIKSVAYFTHQTLVHADLNMYSLVQIEEDLCRHPELFVKIVESFEYKFDPKKTDIAKSQKIRSEVMSLIENLDTGNEINDTRRKNILKQAIYFVDFCLKTNFYRNNKTAHSFRLDPKYLDLVPYVRKEKFPELPFAVFFMKGYHFLGFHIRFKDLSRGGIRTVVPDKIEKMISERNNVFSECYGLAFTQQKKNKDIPEGGAKGVAFVETNHKILDEKEIFQRELEEAGFTKEQIDERLKDFIKEQKLEHMYQVQRSYIESFLTLLNCDDDGTLRAKNIVDYWKKPEYVYLGPDENMHNEMIEWIASYSKYYKYKPGGAFISSKPSAGINHKEFGVTSLGVNVYLEEVLKYLGIDPLTDKFTVKMTGGPDGDVAGNEMENFYKYFPKTAKFLATIDISGTIFDPQGLDLSSVHDLFKAQKPICNYPPEKLSEGGFMLDTFTKKEQSSYAQQTLCWKKINGKLVQEWLSGNEMNQVLRHNVHQTQSDVFIPGGGRPRTLNEVSVKDFLDEAGRPTSRAIVEGANLYITPGARHHLETLGTLIIKDSSANKGGVTCSSFEVLCSLCLSEEEFLKEKQILVSQILEIIKVQARDEARLLLRTHKETQGFLTDISDQISERINGFMYEFLDFFGSLTLPTDPKDPLITALINYCPPLLRLKYQDRILTKIPDIHKKAIIACHIASRLVYQKGLSWTPKVTDVLPLICKEPSIIGPSIA